MEKLAYLIKNRFPVLFRLIALVAERVTSWRYSRRAELALQNAAVEGTVKGKTAVMHPLSEADADLLHEFLNSVPEDHLRYFRPHGFDRATLADVLASKAYLNYGLFVKGELIGYALLKITPTGSAFIGLLVQPEFLGLGLGTFITRFLYWQAAVAGLRARSTISRHNTASLRSHQAVAEYRVVAELPNDYLLIEFPVGKPEKPTLMVR